MVGLSLGLISFDGTGKVRTSAAAERESTAPASCFDPPLGYSATKSNGQFKIIDSPLCKVVMMQGASGSPLHVNAYKNDSYILPAVPAGDFGHMLHVKLSAPGNIYQVDSRCEGEACGAWPGWNAWVHECPDGGKCGPNYLYRVVFNGNTADWYAWSNSAAIAVFHFDVYYQ